MKLKFEHLFALIVLTILAAAMLGAFITGNNDLVNLLVGAFIGALGTLVTFYFKHSVGGNSDGK